MAGRRPGLPAAVDARAAFRVVSPDYFEAMRIRTIDGRTFTEQDTETSQRVLVVSRSFARKYLDDTPIGDVPAGSDDRSEWHRVIGVVEDVRPMPGEDPDPEIFVVYRQWTELPGGQPMLVVRTAGSPTDLAGTLRLIVRSVDPALALGDVRTLDERISEQLARPRLYSGVLATFATLTLLVVGVGLFGVLSVTMAQRSREFALRAALGASARDVVRLVARQGLELTAAGLVVGIAVSLALSRLLSAYLYGVSSREFASYLGVVILLGAAAGAACIVAARRAAGIDPAVVSARGELAMGRLKRRPPHVSFSCLSFFRAGMVTHRAACCASSRTPCTGRIRSPARSRTAPTPESAGLSSRTGTPQRRPER
jgi:putative ABC transport system permease protein